MWQKSGSSLTCPPEGPCTAHSGKKKMFAAPGAQTCVVMCTRFLLPKAS